MDCSTPFRYLSISRKLPISVEITRKSGNFPVIGNTDLVVHQGRVIFIIHMSLLERTKYNLHRMHPWLVPQKGNYTALAHVKPATPYIAISADRRMCFLKNALYFSMCSNGDGKYICTTGSTFQSMNGQKLRRTNDKKTVRDRLPTLRHKAKKRARGVLETITITRGTAVFPPKTETVHISCPYSGTYTQYILHILVAKIVVLEREHCI